MAWNRLSVQSVRSLPFREKDEKVLLLRCLQFLICDVKNTSTEYSLVSHQKAMSFH